MASLSAPCRSVPLESLLSGHERLVDRRHSNRITVYRTRLRRPDLEQMNQACGHVGSAPSRSSLSLPSGIVASASAIVAWAAEAKTSRCFASSFVVSKTDQPEPHASGIVAKTTRGRPDYQIPRHPDAPRRLVTRSCPRSERALHGATVTAPECASSARAEAVRCTKARHFSPGAHRA